MERRRKRKRRKRKKRRRNTSYSISSCCQHTENIKPIQQALNECLMNELNLNKHSPFNYCYFPPGLGRINGNLKKSSEHPNTS